jgi:hypothetical protein
MKRGIAMGVALSVGIILIALLAFYAIRRRKRLAAKAVKTEPVAEVEGDAGFWPLEKPRQKEAQHVGIQRAAPPVETDAHSIHELDADQIPELPDSRVRYELEAEGKRVQASGLDDEYAQTQRQWEMWKYAPEEPHGQPEYDYSGRTLPTLTVSSPGPQTSYNVVSPLGRTPSDITSQTPYLYDIPSPARSPFEEAHLLPHRNTGNYNTR